MGVIQSSVLKLFWPWLWACPLNRRSICLSDGWAKYQPRGQPVCLPIRLAMARLHSLLTKVENFKSFSNFDTLPPMSLPTQSKKKN